MGFFGWYPSSLQPQPPPHWKTAFLIVLPRMAWPQVLAASQNIKFTNVDIFTKFIIHMIGCYILTKKNFFPSLCCRNFSLHFLLLRRHFEWDSTALLAEEPKEEKKVRHDGLTQQPRRTEDTPKTGSNYSKAAAVVVP